MRPNPGEANKFCAKLITFRAAVIIILIQPHLVPKIRRSSSENWGRGEGGGCGPALPSRLSFHDKGDKIGGLCGIIMGLRGSTGATPPSATKPSLPITLPDPGSPAAPRAVAVPRCPGGGTVPKSPPRCPRGTGGIGRPQLAHGAVMATAGLARRPRACGHAGRSSLCAVCP